ncbi:MAG TPA: SDR family NAD(P)-dependent oxidoreductase [Deltaproteobacteria bacterium]|nr:SDR family NAD(P)-dependent oxidoreductase [Deltaproteobacteria bacterium]
MKTEALTQNQIIDMVERRQIAPKEGLKLLKRLQVNGGRALSDSSDLFFCRPVWKEMADGFSSAMRRVSGDILVIYENEAVDKILEDRLGSDDFGQARFIFTKTGTRFEAKGPGRFTIRPDHPDDYNRLLQALNKDSGPPRTILHLLSNDPYTGEENSLKAQIGAGLYSLFFLTRALLALKPTDRVQIIYFYQEPSGRSQPQYAGCSGFARTLGLESRTVAIKTVSIPDIQKIAALSIPRILAVEDVEIRFRGDRYLVRALEESIPDDASDPIGPLKENGVYLLTGGAGGLGFVFAEHLAKQVKAKLILTGRSPLGDEKALKIEALRGLGSEVIYIQADVSRQEAAHALIAQARSRFNRINGVIHCAGIVRDNLIINKPVDDLSAVIAAKVFGTLHMDAATKDEPLDFFVLFSSVSAVTGNMGQADYAYANSFMDHFVSVREQSRRESRRTGKTISINWPLWREGGMRVDAQTEIFLAQTAGMKPLNRMSGLNAFSLCLASSHNRWMVAAGNRGQIRRALIGKPDHAGLNRPDAGVRKRDFLSALGNDVLSIASDILKIDTQDIDWNEDIGEYGFDSISFTEFANRINRQFRLDITPAVFFELPSIGAFTEFLAGNYTDQLSDYYRADSTVLTAPEPKRPAVEGGENLEPFIADRFQLPAVEPVHAGAEDRSIAVIGMSGAMPGSEDPEAFWKHLVAGDDLITEVPKDRWDWRRFELDSTVDTDQIKWGGFMPDVDKFDCLFFGISPREAELMDPQQRLFMETVWKTIEDAGYAPSSLSGTRTGLFVGVATSDYVELVRDRAAEIEAHAATGMSHCILANRISYLLDIHGPSEPIDTACSSSLVAIHRAVEAIRSGSCDAAIAGGVNVILAPSLTIAFGKAGMLSPDGRCKTFDARADGYVRGEGAGAVLLKPLSRAVADGDHIYAVIRGTAENHGGRAKSLTAPNPNAQADLLVDAYENAGVAPDSVTYIEAHGTGTRLGDPIEINGLKKAFEALCKKQGRTLSSESVCGIGSVKTNIGHLETAAGIASVIKVLLALKHRKLPASIHFRERNPYIDLTGSPFYIVSETRDWEPLKDAAGGWLPRRAGVSSFGYGGSNAHIVLEEYQEEAFSVQRSGFSVEPQLIVLSAKNEDRLKEYAERMVKFLDSTLNSEHLTLNLTDFAYTLQVGREAMEERLALVVSDVEELQAELEKYARGDSDTSKLMRGNARTLRGTSEQLVEGRAGAAFVRILMEDRELGKLGQLWNSGFDIDWTLLYPQKPPQRISLPTYPFAKERHWLPKMVESPSEMGSGFHGVNIEQRAKGFGYEGKFHPLLDANISTLKEQRFTTQFTGKEFFLADHVLAGQKTLPGVAYLEMALASGMAAAEEETRKLINIVWASPITVPDKPQNVFISLYPETADDKVGFEVTTLKEEGQRQVHAQGKLIFESRSSIVDEVIDIDSIQTRCTERVSGPVCYQAFQSSGLHYGPAFQTIQELFRSDNEALSLLVLPEELGGSFRNFCLHPSLMDGALQTVGALMSSSTIGTPHVPFALGEVIWIRPLTEKCYAHVTSAEYSVDPNLKKFDIDITNEDGQVLVRMKDLSIRALGPSEDKYETMYFSGQWESSPSNTPPATQFLYGNLLLLDTDETRQNALCEQLKTDVLLVKPGKSFRMINPNTFSIHPGNPDDYRRLMKALKKNDRLPEHIVHLWSQENFTDDAGVLNTQIERSFYSILHLSQALLEFKSRDKIQLLYIYPEPPEDPQPHYAAIAGFAKTIRLEIPRFQYKTIALPDFSHVADVVSAEFQTDEGVEIRYQDGRRQMRHLIEYKPIPDDVSPESLLRENGVYILTGGTGGLGLIFAEYIARQVKTKLVLTGRSPLNEEKSAKIQILNDLGAEAVYIQADISNLEDVKGLIAHVKSRFNDIRGIIHCAGVIRDASIAKKTPEEAASVLAPKVYGTLHLDKETGSEPLDFFVLFSSTTAVLGNAGQSDYAYANSFMDNFSVWREKLRLEKRRFGKTLSINWPLWQDGGMSIDHRAEKLLIHAAGIRLLKTPDGLEAFFRALAMKFSQLTVIDGIRRKVRGLVVGDGLRRHESEDIASHSVARKVEGKLLQNLREGLLKMASEILKIEESAIDLDEDLSAYGFESITFTELANCINEKYKLEITPTLFFEYPSLRSISQFLCETYQNNISEDFRNDASFISRSESDEDTVFVEPIQRNRFQVPHDSVYKHPLPVNVPIAIIGMSGVMPQSENLEIFWQHLYRGNDLITEVPRHRWDWEAWHDHTAEEDIKAMAKWGGFIPDVDKFDPLFFGILPREAELMDPQQRLFLQTVWNTIEDAGYKISTLSGTNTGVFVGVASSDYAEIIRQNVSKVDPYTSTGMAHSVLANRISYLLNLHGPSEPIDTACSSSLVAIHRAVEAIHSGSCEMAIAGGVNAILTPTLNISFGSAGMLSKDGRCKTFDKHADGYVRGEGVGAVLLKPLNRAQTDGDHIYGVIIGTAVNHGGHAASLTAPNPKALAQLLIHAYKRANIKMDTVSYIEAHGTGTALGDPIEIDGLKRAYAELCNGEGKSPTVPAHCGLGSVKTNIGHLETAAGIAGVIKVLLSMKHRKLPPSINFKELNPYIQLEDSPFYIVTAARNWEQLREDIGRPIPRRAGVSSFGFGGANAHIVLEEYEEPEVSGQGSRVRGEPQLIVMSAKNEDRLYAYVEKMLEYLDQGMDVSAPSGKDAPREAVFKKVLILIADILRVGEEDINPEEPFEEYGFDQIGLTGLAEKISERYSLNITSSLFTEYSSISKLAQYLTQHRASSLEHQASNATDLSLSDLAYTLQVGRDAMEERLAVVVSDLEELKEKLKRFSNGEHDYEDFIRGNAKAIKSKSDTLDQGSAGRESVPILIKDRELGKLGQLWVNGFDIDWTLLYPKQQPQRISIPTYPFAKKRYWVPERQATKVKPQVVDETGGMKQIQKPAVLVFQPIWEKTRIESAQPIARNILLFDTDARRRKAFQLRFNGDIILVRPGQQFTKKDSLTYEVNPTNPKDFISLLSTLANRKRPIVSAIHLWALSKTRKGGLDSFFQGATGNHTAGLTEAESDLRAGVYPIYSFIRAVSETHFDSITQLLFLYYGEEEKSNPLFDAISGFSKSLGFVLPKLSIRTVRIASDIGKRTVADIAVQESSIGDRDFKAEIRYEHDDRYVKAFHPLGLIDKKKISTLRKEGVYLITGGAGGLGLIFSRYLAEQYRARLALTGRSPLKGKRKESIDALRRSGAEVLYLQADVSSENEMQQVVREVKNHYGSLNGVIHAAGISSANLITQKEMAEFESTLSPKIKGTLVLDKVTRAESLDFFVLFSSTSAILGDFGQCDYAVANRFIDGYAHMREALRRIRDRQGRTVAINWPLWRDGGLHMDSEAEAFYFQTSGMSYLETTEGLQVFEDILKSDPTQAILISGDKTRIEQFLGIKERGKMPDSRNGDRFIPTVALNDADHSHYLETNTRNIASSIIKDETGEIEQKLQMELLSIVSEISKIDENEIDPGTSLTQYGFASISFTEFAFRINDQFQVEVGSTLFLDYPSIRALSSVLLEKHEDKINSFFRSRLTDNSYPSKSLVPIQSGGTRMPLFCVPGAGGNGHYYYQLSRCLGENQPFFTFLSLGLDGKTEPHKNIPEMASYYIDSIFTIQEKGPYLLGGHSLGARIAYEMALQLLKQGHRVELLVVFDEVAPVARAKDEEYIDDDAYLICEAAAAPEAFNGIDLKISYDDIENLTWEKQINYMKERYQSAGLFPLNGTLGQFRGMMDVYKAQRRLNYIQPPKANPFRIVFFRSDESNRDIYEKPEIQEDASWGWSRFSAHPVEIFETPGTHNTMLADPNVRSVAKRLKDVLAEAINESQSDEYIP